VSSARSVLNIAGGTVPEDYLYISRPEDDEVFDLLSQGIYCNVLSSRQMGKSSLMFRVRRRLEKERFRVLRVDLSALGGQNLGDRAVAPGVAWHNALMKALARGQAEADRVRPWLSARPAEPMGARFRAYVDEFLLPGTDRWVIIFDEVDVTRELDFTDELFLAIRSMFDDRAANPELGRIAFCMVGVFAADDLVKSKKTTPYNVGHTVRLLDFSRERCDLSGLEQYLEDNGLPGQRTLDQVLAWTSGQPFLTITLCDRAVRERNRGGRLADFVREELTNPTAFKVHFDRMEQVVRERITASSSLRARYLRMLWGLSVPALGDQDETTFLLAGLIRRTRDGRLETRNTIYRRRFDKRWVEAILPAPPVPVAVRAALVVSGVLLLVGGPVTYLSWRAKLQRDAEASKQELARREQQLGNQIGAAESDDVAQAAWLAGAKLGLPYHGALLKAAHDYWDKRLGELDSAARELESRGCVEETYLVRVYAHARGSAQEPAVWSPHQAATLWLPAVEVAGSDVESCRAKRVAPCESVSFTSGGVVASCDTRVVSFPERGPSIDYRGSDTHRTLLTRDGTWSAGLLTGRPGWLAVRHADKVVAVAVCPAQAAPEGQLRPALRDLLVREGGGTLTLAYLCEDGTYALQRIADLDAWFSRLRPALELRGEGGYLAGAIAWLGHGLVAARFGPKGQIRNNRGVRLDVPGLSAIGSFDVGVPRVAFGTAWEEGETPSATIGIADLTVDPPVVARQWPVGEACTAPPCLVRAVSGATASGGVAAITTQLEPHGRSTSLIFAGDGPVVAISVEDMTPTAAQSVALGDWSGDLTAAVVLPGRIGLYRRTAAAKDTWDSAQARTGLMVVPGKSVQVRRTNGTLTPLQGFDDVFPPR
jgi:hypothetical protein